MKAIIQLIRETFDFFYQLFLNRELISTLSVRGFKQAYIRNFFGLVWAILDPLAFVLILYIVFGARYADKGANAVSFSVYLITGFVAFDFFNSTMLGVTNSIKNHAFLLKKVSFRVAILPIVTLLSSLMLHGIVLSVTILVMIYNRIWPSFYWIQLFYYIFAVSALLVSIGWLTSSIYLFFPDIRNIVSIITRIMFFVTPIFWDINGLPPRSQFILKLNPVFYIVNGYRDCLLYNKALWQHPVLPFYFWSLVLVFLVIGGVVFKKFGLHFAEVVF